MYSFWESTHHSSHHSGKLFCRKTPITRKSSSVLFVLHRCTWGRTPDRHLFLHFTCLYPDSTWFECLPPGAVVSWDAVPCLMNHFWKREKPAELKKLSNPPNLWQMSLIHRFLEFVISFSWKMQQRIQLKWIPDNNWWLFFGHGSIPNNFYMPRICSWFLGKLHQTEDDDWGGLPNPSKSPWDAWGSSIFISVVWFVARSMPNTWHWCEECNLGKPLFIQSPPKSRCSTNLILCKFPLNSKKPRS